MCRPGAEVQEVKTERLTITHFQNAALYYIQHSVATGSSNTLQNSILLPPFFGTGD